MSLYYYHNEGEPEVRGPFAAEQFPDLLGRGIIGPETQICALCPPGEENWQPLRLLPELFQAPANAAPLPPPNTEEQTQVDLKAIKEAGSDVLPAPVDLEGEESDEIDDPTESKADKKRRRGRSEIKAIGDELDKLWATQRDSILSRIKDADPEEENVAVRKHWRESYNFIERSALAYWRRTKRFEQWIEALAKEEADTVHRLRGANNREKFDDAKAWLVKAKLWDNAGTYAFIKDGRYLYAGKASDSLATRLTDHFKNTLRFNDSTHLRIIIPQYKKWVGKVERLLILAYKPEETKMPGDVGNNDADNLLGFIAKEVSELINDAPVPPR